MTEALKDKNTADTNDMTQGVIWKQLLKFFVPIALGSLLQQMYNTVDSMIVGQFAGTAELGAVGGVTGTLLNLIIGFFVGVSSGAAVVVSQFFGAKQPKRTNTAIHTSMALSLVVSVLISVLGIYWSPVFLRWTGTPPEVFPHAVIYIRIIFGGVIFGLTYNMGASILRSLGDSKRPFYLLIMGTVFNLFADLLFVAVFRWGTAGAAIATVLGQALCAVAVWWLLARIDGQYALRISRLSFDRAILRRIVLIGLPTGVQSAMWAISNVVIQTAVNSFGVTTVAAQAIFTKIDGLYWMASMAWGASVTTFAGQNFGAGRIDRMVGALKPSMIAMCLISFLSSTLIFVFWRPVFMLFTDNEAVLAVDWEMIVITIPYLVTYICIEVMSGIMRGAGETFMPTVMTFAGICALRLVWIWFVLPFHHTVTTMYASYPISWIVTSIAFVIYYYRANWLDRCLAKWNSDKKMLEHCSDDYDNCSHGSDKGGGTK